MYDTPNVISTTRSRTSRLTFLLLLGNVHLLAVVLMIVIGSYHRLRSGEEEPPWLDSLVGVSFLLACTLSLLVLTSLVQSLRRRGRVG